MAMSSPIQNQTAAGLAIIPGDLTDPRVIELLRIHLAMAHAESPACSVHALDLDGLRRPDITFWAAWDGARLAAVGALRDLGVDHGEVKSMHTAEALRRRGAGGAMLRRIIDTARGRGYSRLSLETGSSPYFDRARALYGRHGFVDCPPFGDYGPDPFSVFLTLDLARRPD